MKTFFCAWAEGYATPEALPMLTATHTMEFFGPHNGYDNPDTVGIDALGIGETWTAPTPEVHIVMRLS